MTTVCYVGESPDDDNNCPSCGQECTLKNMKTGIGKHIHECAASLKHDQAQLSANEAFKPSHCLWDGCSKASTIWETRDAHLKHLENHLTWVASVSTSGESRRCKWELCEEPAHTDWYLSDWAFHFAAAHGINPNKAVIVDHCALCGEWVEDQKGDRSAWNAHCKIHYKAMFSPFKHRLQGHVSHHDKKLKITNDIAEYKPNAPFDNKRPLLHGHIQQSIALRPFFCPFCVYDNDLLMYMRMKQYRDNTVYTRHVFQQHLYSIKTDVMCPVPSCGTHTFALFDLVTHLVLFHRLPLSGTAPSRKKRRLRIPVKDDDGNLAVSLAQNKHQPKKQRIDNSDDDDDDDDDDTRPLYVCSGCRHKRHDIQKHLETSSLNSLCRKRGTYYKLAKDGTKLDQAVHHEFSKDISAAGSAVKKGRYHYCTLCQLQFTDIRDHIPRDCQSLTFRIKDPNNPDHRRARNATLYIFSEWIKTNAL